jgi:3',5'-cyclic AMP phosphodiesterase CpdA
VTTTEVFVGAGDIGWCGSLGTPITANMADAAGGTVFTTGDNAYFQGTAQNYRDCYEPSWGRFKSRTYPTPGNHEYESPGAAPYFDYFGSNAGPTGLGYYGYPIGSWYALSLNSNISVGANSAQGQWLRAELAEHRNQCIVAYWHHPLFSSSRNGDHPVMRDFWRLLYDAGVDVILNGHDHVYEKFARQDPDGRRDPTRGIQQFTVGTGGAELYPFSSIKANSEVRLSSYGVLKLLLKPGGYSWEFLAVSGRGDAGQVACH